MSVFCEVTFDRAGDPVWEARDETGEELPATQVLAKVHSLASRTG